MGKGKLTEEKKTMEKKNECETGKWANVRAVSRFYLYDSCFSISSWCCLHDASQRPNAPWCLVFQDPNDFVHFEWPIVAV